MSALPPPADFQSAPSDRAGPSAAFDERTWERNLGGRPRGARWIGWRLRALVIAALIGCLALFVLIRVLAAVPALPVALQGSDHGVLLLPDSAGVPRAVRALVDAQGRTTVLDILLLHRSARWLVDDADRARQSVQHDALANALAAGEIIF